MPLTIGTSWDSLEILFKSIVGILLTVISCVTRAGRFLLVPYEYCPIIYRIIDCSLFLQKYKTKFFSWLFNQIKTNINHHKRNIIFTHITIYEGNIKRRYRRPNRRKYKPSWVTHPVGKENFFQSLLCRQPEKFSRYLRNEDFFATQPSQTATASHKRNAIR